MKILEDVAAELARTVFEAERKTGSDRISEEVSKSLGDSSTTLQEAYLASIRYLRAQARANEIVTSAYRKADIAPPLAGKSVPTAPTGTSKAPPAQARPKAAAPQAKPAAPQARPAAPAPQSKG